MLPSGDMYNSEESSGPRHCDAVALEVMRLYDIIRDRLSQRICRSPVRQHFEKRYCEREASIIYSGQFAVSDPSIIIKL